MSKNKRILIYICLGLILLIFLIQRNDSDFNIEKEIGIYNRPFREYVVFYPQHQDDEVLWGGSALRRAIKTQGVDNVFVVLVSDGTGVNVFNNKIYKNKSRKEKEKLRDKEFDASLSDLGVKKENIIILANIDNRDGNHFELMREVALNFEEKYKSVTHIAHTYEYDEHSMHRKNGKVIYKLYKEGKINDAMFYLKPNYIKKVSSDKRIIYKVESHKDYNAIVKACNEYKVIDEEKNRRGIGYISAHSYFDNLLKDPYLTSYLHLP